MGVLIDTSIFIAAERGTLDLSKQLTSLPPSSTFAVSAMTASELLHGVHRASTTAQQVKRQAFVNGILSQMPCVSFDLAAATIHAQLSATLASQGAPVGAHDLIIAATAISIGYDVATRDLRSFPRIPGVNAVQW